MWIKCQLQKCVAGQVKVPSESLLHVLEFVTYMTAITLWRNFIRMLGLVEAEGMYLLLNYLDFLT